MYEFGVFCSFLGPKTARPPYDKEFPKKGARISREEAPSPKSRLRGRRWRHSLSILHGLAQRSWAPGSPETPKVCS